MGRSSPAIAAIRRPHKPAHTTTQSEEKLERLRELAARDAVMAQKELRYTRVKMSSRLSSDAAVVSYADETDRSDLPAFPRKNGSEGAGRK